MPRRGEAPKGDKKYDDLDLMKDVLGPYPNETIVLEIEKCPFVEKDDYGSGVRWHDVEGTRYGKGAKQTSPKWRWHLIVEEHPEIARGTKVVWFASDKDGMERMRALKEFIAPGETVEFYLRETDDGGEKKRSLAIHSPAEKRAESKQEPRARETSRSSDGPPRQDFPAVQAPPQHEHHNALKFRRARVLHRTLAADCATYMEAVQVQSAVATLMISWQNMGCPPWDEEQGEVETDTHAPHELDPEQPAERPQAARRDPGYAAKEAERVLREVREKVSRGEVETPDDDEIPF